MFSEETEPSQKALESPHSVHRTQVATVPGVNCFCPPIGFETKMWAYQDKIGLLLPLLFRLFCSAVVLDLLPHKVVYSLQTTCMWQQGEWGCTVETGSLFTV